MVPRILKDPITGRENNVVHVKIGERNERPIYDMGDGIQTIVLLTIQAFLTEEPTIFFIEEPEQNVHAGLQRIIIDAFRQRPKHMYFMTTHSNHFIDMAQEYGDVSLQRVHQEVDKDSEVTVVESSDANMRLLQGLGVRASSVLNANCSIWVEGITDKLYLKAYMQKYLSLDETPAEYLHFKENLHYIFTEYQGSNITHWNFDDQETKDETHAKSLISNILLIADKDIDAKGTRVESLEKALGEGFELLAYKEIENYLPIEVLKAAAKKRWESFNSKGESTIDLTSITQDSISVEDDGIGSILEPCITRINAKEGRKFYEDKSGTIKDKVKFCETAVELMASEDVEWELTQDLKDLCEKIFMFINMHSNL
ncbi:hypothetical protein MACH09_45270 [Vibrio sp. MACH09]|uniref:ATP-dependent nuclease n=1 Tax=Vibrio sp. MACH09 TaxID=3025122 RepID=UPI00278CED17|nr:AAA family ATPase [Vibrio sp. MACH09]GLO64019.1 hypothetical protein MACH09_45270 [Vibrio sp. MACH09]